MTIGMDNSQRRAAKVAGAAYLISLATVVGITYGVIAPLIAKVDPVQAARNILANETLFRVGILGNLLYSLEIVVLSGALYVVLKPVDPLLALLATLSRLALAFTWLVISLDLFTALRLITQPEYAHILPPDQLPVLARLFLSGSDPYYVGLLFWCLGSTLAAILWFRSRYIPRPVAAFGFLASAWGAGCTLVLYVFPGFREVVDPDWFDVPMVFFETALSVLLLVRGLRSPAVAVEQEGNVV
jgi:hypothetical protein